MVSVVVVNKTAKHKLRLVPCELTIDFLCLVGQEFKEIEIKINLKIKFDLQHIQFIIFFL